jgi:hypothetical protein
MCNVMDSGHLAEDPNPHSNLKPITPDPDADPVSAIVSSYQCSGSVCFWACKIRIRNYFCIPSTSQKNKYSFLEKSIKTNFLFLSVPTFEKLRFWFSTSYGSGSNSQKVTVPVPQHWLERSRIRNTASYILSRSGRFVSKFEKVAIKSGI